MTVRVSTCIVPSTRVVVAVGIEHGRPDDGNPARDQLKLLHVTREYALSLVKLPVTERKAAFAAAMAKVGMTGTAAPAAPTRTAFTRSGESKLQTFPILSTNAMNE